MIHTWDHMITCDDVIVVPTMGNDLVLQSAINDSGGLTLFLWGVVFSIFLSIECSSCEEVSQ